MDQVENELYPLAFEKVVEDNPDKNPFGLPMKRQATYETLYIGEGKSIEPIQINFCIYANETVEQAVVDDLLAGGVRVECGIQPYEDDSADDSADLATEDGSSVISANVVQTEGVDQNLNIDKTLVFTFEIDEGCHSKLPGQCRLTFIVDPQITPGIKHLYTFSGNAGQVNVDVQVSRGKVEAEIDNSRGGKIKSKLLSESDQVTQDNLKSNPPGPHHLSVIAVGADSVYKISGTREIRFDDQPESTTSSRR